MKKVGIVMGSDSDMPVMSKAAAILDKLGVEYEMIRGNSNNFRKKRKNSGRLQKAERAGDKFS